MQVALLKAIPGVHEEWLKQLWTGLMPTSANVASH
jgi:hypothetical protein